MYSEEKLFPVFAQKCNLKAGGISLEQARFLDPTTINKWNTEYRLRTGDILINSTGTGTVGRTRLFDDKCLGSYPFVVPDSHVSVVRTFNEINSFFVYSFISSSLIQEYLEDNLAGSTNQKELYINILEDLLIPVPPKEEQYRIVEAINQYLSIIQDIEKNRTYLTDAVKQLKTRVLDLALSGRLTSHTSHYQQLPDGWEYKQLEEVADIFDNVRIPLNAQERENRIRNKQSSELYPYYGATGQVGLVEEYLLEGKFLLLGEDGAPFLDKNAIKAYPVEGRFWVNNHAHILKPKYDFDFLMYYLNDLDYKAYVSGSTRLKLTQSAMSKIIVLLPPQQEQCRISQILNRLFEVLDSMAEQL